jgi:hypothetical protein
MSDDLAVLAAAQLEDTRNAMRLALSNGAADPAPIRPTGPGAAPAKPKRARAGKAKAEPKAARSGKAKAAKPAKPPPHGPHAERLAKSAVADEKVLTLLRGQPGARTGEIRQVIGAKSSTLSERLRRLARQGRVERSGAGWAATSP